MDPLRWHAPGRQAGAQVAEEARRPANVEVAVSRNAQLIEDLHPQVTGRVVVPPLSIIRRWPAVPDPTLPASKRCKKLPHLRGEGMRLAVACAVQPPNGA